MGVSHHRFHLEIFFLCECARPFPLYHAFFDILDSVEDWLWCRQALRKLELMWKPPIVCRGTWHMAHNYSQKNTIFDTHATPITEAKQWPDCSYASIHLFCIISFWLNIAVRSHNRPPYLSNMIFYIQGALPCVWFIAIGKDNSGG